MLGSSGIRQHRKLPRVRASSAVDQAVAEEALRIYRVVAEAMAQPFAQLADVALDDILVDVLAEETVDVVEDLRLGHPAALVVDEILENAPLAARQRQHLTGDLGIAAVVEHAHVADDSP